MQLDGIIFSSFAAMEYKQSNGLDRLHIDTPTMPPLYFPMKLFRPSLVDSSRPDVGS